jgi:uncharacterized protein
MPNQLAFASSPYLLQHKNNPVEWIQWSPEAFEKAATENKLILVSIGYSACHWCHVMEHECFEDEEVAQLMNEHFVCIKVDREERPDVDKYYMEAVQLMSQQGGWPLNCFALPDKKPFFGGTYFPKEKWMGVLRQIVKLKETENKKLVDFAQRISDGIVQNAHYFSQPDASERLTGELVIDAYQKWAKIFDNELGGSKGAPKFPLPSSYLSLLQFGALTQTSHVLEHVELTLQEMARGGLYDQIGGGFTRYSVDDKWKVPHFEKMLYDNAQLIQLYARGFAHFKQEEMADVVRQTIAFCQRELSREDLFLCALDADSEGEEGKYYVWDWDELVQLLDNDFEFARFYYNFNAFGSWEGHYIPLRQMNDADVALHFELSEDEVKRNLSRIKEKLFSARQKRIRPATDDKILCSWNALLVKGLLTSGEQLREPKYVEDGLRTLEKLIGKYTNPDSGEVIRTITNLGPISGFLDDYAQLIDALIIAFETTSTESYLSEAVRLTYGVLDKFYNETSGLFRFSAQKDTLAEQVDCIDDVIPSSNAVMAHNLWRLAEYMGNAHFEKVALLMVENCQQAALESPYNFSHWLSLMTQITFPRRVLVISGKDAEYWKKQIQSRVNFNDTILLLTKESELPIFAHRFSMKVTHTFVCSNKSCSMPITSLAELMIFLDRN